MEEAGWKLPSGKEGATPLGPPLRRVRGGSAASAMSARQGRDGAYQPARGNARQRGPEGGDARAVPSSLVFLDFGHLKDHLLMQVDRECSVGAGPR